MDKLSVERHRRNVTSAMYFLVWHCGMSIPHAESVLTYYRSSIEPLAEAGRAGYAKCESAILRLIKRKARRKRK